MCTNKTYVFGLCVGSVTVSVFEIVSYNIGQWKHLVIITMPGGLRSGVVSG